MKLWIDDVRPAPNGYYWCKSVRDAIGLINCQNIDLLDLDHDAGDYNMFGGDYIKILDYMEEHNINIPIHIHSMNPVGRQNMLNIAYKNHWVIV